MAGSFEGGRPLNQADAHIRAFLYVQPQTAAGLRSYDEDGEHSTPLAIRKLGRQFAQRLYDHAEASFWDGILDFMKTLSKDD